MLSSRKRPIVNGKGSLKAYGVILNHFLHLDLSCGVPIPFQSVFPWSLRHWSPLVLHEMRSVISILAPIRHLQANSTLDSSMTLLASLNFASERAPSVLDLHHTALDLIPSSASVVPTLFLQSFILFLPFCTYTLPSLLSSCCSVLRLTCTHCVAFQTLLGLITYIRIDKGATHMSCTEVLSLLFSVLDHRLAFDQPRPEPTDICLDLSPEGLDLTGSKCYKIINKSYDLLVDKLLLVERRFGFELIPDKHVYKICTRGKGRFKFIEL